MARSARQDIKVGVFVLGLLGALGATLWVLGGSSEMLKDRYTLNASFSDVGGLQEGAVVRLAGWNVGEVTAIRFSDDLSVKEMFVEMKVMEEYAPRIRKDSEARIETQGVLGDKYVSVTMGSPTVPQLDDDAWIETRDPLNLIEYQKKPTDLLASTENISRKVDTMLGSDQEAAAASLARSFQHIESILGEAKQGKGLLHALIYDESLARKVTSTVTNLESSSVALRDVTDEIKTGDGLANQLIYGDEGATLAKELSDVAAALDTLTNDIMSDDSLVHALIYDPSKATMLDDLAATASALRVASEAVANGDGTAGMLANDPALYEDLRALVGGAQRNKLLRAYIRATVEKGEEANASPWKPVE